MPELLYELVEKYWRTLGQMLVNVIRPIVFANRRSFALKIPQRLGDWGGTIFFKKTFIGI